jgi:hypothetical protein
VFVFTCGVQVAAHVPTRSKIECVNHFIQLPFGDNFCLEPEEPKPPVVGTGGTPKKNAGKVGVSAEEAALSDHVVANGAAPFASPSEATPDAGAEGVAAAHELVSPFTDTSHPLFAQVRMQALEYLATSGLPVEVACCLREVNVLQLWCWRARK